MNLKTLRKSIRIDTDLDSKIESFMKSAQDPEAEKVIGKKTVGSSKRKAIKYLFNAWFDPRGFKSRGLFDGSLIKLSENTDQIKSIGQELNRIVHAINAGQPPKGNRLEVLMQVQGIIAENMEQLTRFSTSIKIDE
ncbi:hypothetical protein KKI24_12465 [bacterium]|nr:hypothetical protein [bacterium]